MRVALVGPYPADTTKLPGGVSAVTFYVAQGLRHLQDVELHVIAPIKGIQDDYVVEDGGMTVHYIASPRKRLVPNLLANIGRVRAALDQIKPDVVHFQAASLAAAGIDAGYPTVITIHGVAHMEIQYQPRLSDKLSTLLEATLIKRAVSRAKHCIANANYARQAYAKYTRAKWHFVYNPVEDRFFDIKSNEIENKMLSATLISRRKNVLGLVKAFHLIHKQDPKQELFVCGKVTQPDYDQQVHRYVELNSLGDAIHLLGFVSQDELGRHFSEASVIALFSREETAPVLLAQAMCAGKCIIASRAGGTPDMITDGETGFLVNVGDEEGFAKRALELLHDPELRRRLGSRAREVAEQRFRQETLAALTLAVYREAIAD